MLKPIPPVEPKLPIEDEEVVIKESHHIGDFVNAESLLNFLQKEKESGIDLTQVSIEREYEPYDYSNNHYEVLVIPRLRKRGRFEFQKALSEYKKDMESYKKDLEKYRSKLPKYREFIESQMKEFNLE